MANLPLVTTVVVIMLWTSQGEAVAVGTTGPIVLGMLSASAYALLASQLMPALGASGACLAWALAVGCVTLPTLAVLRRRRSSTPLTEVEAAGDPQA